jgi:hypothetical protein
MGILSVHPNVVAPHFFCLLLAELLHFISVEMTEAFASSDANKKGFLFIVFSSRHCQVYMHRTG